MDVITKAVFLDKHAMLNLKYPCNLSVGHIEWLPDTVEGLRLLHLAGYALIVVAQEDEAAQESFTPASIWNEEIVLRMSLAALGIPLVGFYHCPYRSQGTLAAIAHEGRCRKPKPELLIQAACKLNFDLQLSWMIGDVLDDMETGRAAGCRTILLTNGNETDWNMTEHRWPNFLAADMLEASSLVLLTDADHLLDSSRGALGADDE